MTPEQRASADAIAQATPGQSPAVAGSGKTTTIVAGLRETPSSREVLACAFNRSIKETLEKRLADHKNVTCKTLNGLGHTALARAMGKLTLDSRKTFKLLQEATKNIELSQDDFTEVLSAIASAKRNGMAPAGIPGVKGLVADSEEEWLDYELDPKNIGLARKVYRADFQETLRRNIDFDDQLLAPIILDLAFQRYPQIVVDEAQDLNPLQHEMLVRSSKNIFAVGDSYQSIYGFRGAVTNSMGALAARFKLQDFPLTCSFRCPKAVVREAQFFVPHMRAWAEAPEGQVTHHAQWDISQIPGSATILCRYNAPLVALAYQFLAAGRHVNMLGRDFCKGLERLIKKLGVEHIVPLLERLRSWQETETAKARAAGKDSRAQRIEDQAEAIFALAHVSEAGSATDLIEFLRRMTQSTSGVTLSSIHRAKGLEWPEVFFLGREQLPRRNLSDEALQQELNCIYVAITRAQEHLHYLPMPPKEHD